MGRYSDYGWSSFAPYVPVAERRRQAQKEMEKLKKKGMTISPVVLSGKAIASTFWGKAWCDNLEAYSDFENRLPRGRTYVRNGSVVHLEIGAGRVHARVSGSSIYTIDITIAPLAAPKWRQLVRECSGKIDSLVELLRGKLSGGVMEIITRKGSGLFPAPKEIKMSCSCPDWAGLCKHLAAVLYGVGARLDERPELLFQLRKVEHQELLARAASGKGLGAAAAPGKKTPKKALKSKDLSALFGIDMEGPAPPAQKTRPTATPRPPQKTRPARKPAPARA